MTAEAPLVENKSKYIPVTGVQLPDELMQFVERSGWRQVAFEVDPDNDRKLMITINGARYPTVLQQSYGSGIINPNVDQLRQYVGGMPPQTNLDAPLAVITSVMSEGRCGANCRECEYAFGHVNSLLGAHSFAPGLARYTDVNRMALIVNYAYVYALQKGLLQEGDQIRINGLGAGDPAFNPDTSKIIEYIASLPFVAASRWSSTFTDTKFNVVEGLKEGLIRAKEINPYHKARVQASIWSTDEQIRWEHVWQDGHGGNLVPFAQLAQLFQEVQPITGFTSSVSFVVHRNSVIDEKVLRQNFSPDTTWVTLRPVIKRYQNSDMFPMDSEEFASLFFRIRNEGFNVVYMPTIDEAEQANPITGMI